MRRALDLALNGSGSVSPNPLVGAVIVHNDRVIGEGWHEKFGGPHAEVNAVSSVKNPELLRESTIYVTLEPCSHHGKTPPCADMLVEKEFRKVVVGITDPNPEVAGRGLRKLREAGIEVVEDVLKEECREMNCRFLTAMTLRRPYMILKWAQTADGFIARTDFSSKWISGEASRSLVHKWRSEEDAILAGPNTIIHDDPSLNVRDWNGKNPVRVVLDRTGRIPADRRVFTDGGQTLYYSTQPDQGNRQCTHIQTESDNFVRLVLEDLRKRGVMSVFAEGGAGIHRLLLEQGLWDEVRVFKSEVVFGNGIPAPAIPAGSEAACMIDKDKLLIIKKTGTWQKNS